MKKIIALLMTAACVFTFAGCGGNPETPSDDETTVMFTNPLWPSFADPCIIRDDTDGAFYVYATAGTTRAEDNAWGDYNIPILKTYDLINYEFVGEVFEGKTPNWKGKDDDMLWAPDIVKIGDTYNLYYSLVSRTDENGNSDQNPGIGVATASSPAGPFTDQGKILTVEESGVNNGIDPCVFVEEGSDRVYMTWGSFRGIYGIELTSDGLAVKDPDTGGPMTDRSKMKKDGKPIATWLAGTETDYPQYTQETFEGSYVRYINGYYYMFLSQGTCCDGITGSTYHVKVGRSENPLGPYVYGPDDKSMKGKDTGNLVVRGTMDAVAPGHNAIIQDDAGDYWIVYHAYVYASVSSDRCLFIDKLLWDEDGYPYVLDMKPQVTSQAAPYIETK